MGQNASHRKDNDRGQGNADKVTIILFNQQLILIIQEKKRKHEPPVPTRIGKRKKGSKGPDAANKLPAGNLNHFIQR